MSQATQTRKTPLLPPDEQFWERYSPHHEFPLASVTSLLIHGLAIGIMVLGGLWYLLARESETHKPPTMDVVQLAGGDGLEGLAGDTSVQGDPKGNLTEVVPLQPNNTQAELAPIKSNNLKEAPRVELELPEVGPMDIKTDLESALAKLAKEAADQATKEPTAVKKIAMPGVGLTKGNSNQTNIGGPGKGAKGVGSGKGGVSGRNKTKAEIYASRWHFDISGSGKDHANKLAAVGVTLAVYHPNGQYLFVQDLRRRPVDLQPGNLEKFKDAVQWENTNPGSLYNLARELKLPYIPAKVVMLLPRDREEKMADEEFRFAKSAGRNPQEIRITFFDFRLQNGVYEPVILKQE